MAARIWIEKIVLKIINLHLYQIYIMENGDTNYLGIIRNTYKHPDIGPDSSL